MKIAIIAAMQEELAHVKKALEQAEKHVLRDGQVVHSGRLSGHDVVCSRVGIGGTLATLSIVQVLTNFKADALINIGAAGGMGPVGIRDVVVASEVCYADFDTTPVEAVNGAQFGQVPGEPRFFKTDADLVAKAMEPACDEDFKLWSGLSLSGNRFVHTQGQAAEILKHFPDTYSVDMESAAVGHVCTRYKCPFVIIRSISDLPLKETPGDFRDHLDACAVHSTQVLDKMLRALPSKA